MERLMATQEAGVAATNDNNYVVCNYDFADDHVYRLAVEPTIFPAAVCDDLFRMICIRNEYAIDLSQEKIKWRICGDYLSSSAMREYRDGEATPRV
ncbi:hypothetical protein EVAR_71938_1, partial [Eumeta japonica]